MAKLYLFQEREAIESVITAIEKAFSEEQWAEIVAISDTSDMIAASIEAILSFHLVAESLLTDEQKRRVARILAG